jgi:hypothetical protein
MLNLIDIFFKNIQISDFIKIPPVGTEMYHVDGQTDMTKLIVAFHNFVNMSKNWTYKVFTTPQLAEGIMVDL